MPPRLSRPASPPRPVRALPPETEAERSFRWALWAAFLVTVARLLWLALDRTDLYPDEAQYWVWSRHLAWGYYSKPPVVAWLIALSTAVFRDSGPAVRLPAPLLQFGAALLVYGTARRLYDPKTAFWSAVTYATLVGVTYASVIMSTDGPLLLAWAAALYAFVRARESGDRRWWLLVGAAVGLGLLSKYAMAYWLAGAFLFVLAVPGERRHLPMLLGASALGLLVYSPNLLWNIADGFLSYRHTAADADLGGTLIRPLRFLEFLGAQFGVFGPLLFGALILMIALARRSFREPRAMLLLCFTLPPLVLMLALSLLSRANANWALPSYVAGTILVVAWLLAVGRRTIVIAAVALHVVAAVVILAGIRDISAWAGMPVPVRLDPLHRIAGWRSLGRAVTSLLLQHPGALVMADDRELLAALMFYVRPHPLDALEWDPGNVVHDGFELAQQPALDLGANFLLVSRHPGHLKQILARFRQVGPPQSIAVFVGAAGATPSSPPLERRYRVYYLEGFKGFPPAK
jgi:4-amino-4-deoxy-L-arabinose transferase-like glycosyltransferase